MSEQDTPKNKNESLQPQNHLATEGLGVVALSGQEVIKPSSGLSVSIDREKLLSTELPQHIESPRKQQELRDMLENFAKLPERLDFTPGITLIVGENGGGKSTLARALFLAAQYADHRELFVSRGSTEEQAQETALHVTFADSQSSAGIETSLSGIAREVGMAMTDGVDLQSTRPPAYTDIGEMYGDAQHKAREQASDKAHIKDIYDPETHRGARVVEHEEGSLDEGWGSTRQTIDQRLRYIKERRVNPPKRRKLGNRPTNGPAVCTIDEPETGLAPRRHNEIEDEIYDIFGSPDTGNTLIVPTNSVVLFNSDLPRIDLDYPERGIHRPSEYSVEEQKD